ncbi:type III-B CRISPR module RAMP protein Cmr1 [Halothiobacillus diazotrophicus]|uniref:Type III-B CRISPR module RAMP protein Cmr1 n=1 Tax=Halothiobacillus diazotrophicus TaxID=1860122 RepID=A0A191ZFK6_9GAMM|nr:type III-B CRISPR module RAMP protein Cmr1 [Halothiobacillus diazotrophicus]ANJ66664.1 type III-B CRISPR module RAMP protein Cmr1 [Halothiobacillus diazotrophicus]
MPLKFKDCPSITATYRIVVPMFLGDAQQKASAISPLSVKGALRFWWRALNWSRFRSAEPSDTAALHQLHLEEAALFGSAAENGQAARFTLRVHSDPHELSRAADWPKVSLKNPCSEYCSSYVGLGLWGSGQVDKGNYQPPREYIRENQVFTVELLALPGLSEAALQQLRDSLTAWGLFGGLGSRARRGFGAVAIESLDHHALCFNDVATYQEAVRRLWPDCSTSAHALPPFTAFSSAARFGISGEPASSARKAHNELAQAFKTYRGSKDSPVRGARKRVFGIPIDFRKSKRAKKSPLEEKAGSNRRASPLLFHVHPIGDRFTAAVLYLPAEFHFDPELNAVEFPLAEAFLEQLPAAVFA